MDNANQSIVGLQKHNLKLDYYESWRKWKKFVNPKYFE
jgi:hypothetical protein